MKTPSQPPKKTPRRQQILESLARMLEQSPGARITTAALAKEVGVSEAALYRHFPSKTKMFEGLIEFIEDTIFTKIGSITKESSSTVSQCEQILWLLLLFCERNPGMTRILIGDAITGETDRLRHRVIQLFERIETQIKQILREGEIKEGLRTRLPANIAANSLMAMVEGRVVQYVRSEFKRVPTTHWPEQLSVAMGSFFHEKAEAINI